jgi:hypothetical protein
VSRVGEFWVRSSGLLGAPELDQARALIKATQELEDEQLIKAAE